MPAAPLLLAAALVLQAPAKPYILEVAGFKIAMPARANERLQKIPTAVGEIEAHVYMLEQGNIVYLASYMDYPAAVAEADPDVLLEGAVDGAVKNTKGKLLTKRDVKIGAIPGKQFDFSFPGPGGKEGMNRSLAYASGARMYLISVLGDKAEVRTKKADDFLKSFAFGKPPGAKAVNPTPSGAPAKKAAAAKMPAAVGKGFVSKEGGFRVVMPGVPKEQIQEIPTAIGKIDMHLFVLDQGDTGFLAIYANYPDSFKKADPDKILEGGVDGSIQQTKGTLLAKRNIKIGQVPGKEYDYKIPLPGGQTGLGRSRIYFDGSRLYQVIYLSGKDKAIPQVAVDYLQSFEILPKP